MSLTRGACAEASDIHVEDAREYKASCPKSQWDIKPDSDPDRINGTPALGARTAPRVSMTDTFYRVSHRRHSERRGMGHGVVRGTRSRCDRPKSSLKMLPVIGEYLIDAETLAAHFTISGCCEYGGVPGTKELDQGLVAIEVEKRYHLLPNSGISVCLPPSQQNVFTR